MNWSAFAAFISGLTLLIVLLGGAHFSGKIVEKVTVNEDNIQEQKERIDKHDTHLNRIDLALVKLEQYQEGFTAASRIMSSHPPVKAERREEDSDR